MLRPCLLFPLALLAGSLSLSAQSLPVPTQVVHIPLGKTLTKALRMSSLTTPGSRPFHVTMHIHDAMDPTLQADIEEFWASPTLWKRTIVAPGLRQTTTVNETGTHVENTGDYFPLWLRGFVNALFDPVPNASQWNTPGAQLEQKIFPSGGRSPRCLAGRVRVRAGEPPAGNASICFLHDGPLASIQLPEYNIGFSGFADYRGKRIPHLYISQSGPDAYLVGKIMKLEDSYQKPDFFATPPGATTPDALSSLNISQPQIERMAETPIHIVWAPVHRGKTEGTVTMFVSVDHAGRVREANFVRSDNDEVIAAARDQLCKMQWKAATSNGNPIQVEGLIRLPFSTTISPDATTVATDTIAKMPMEVTGGRILKQQKPIYPAQAAVAHLLGPVYLRAIIGKDGTIARLGVIDSPSPILSDAAMAAVRQWKYEPTLVDGEATEIYTVITVQFKDSNVR